MFKINKITVIYIIISKMKYAHVFKCFIYLTTHSTHLQLYGVKNVDCIIKSVYLVVVPLDIIVIVVIIL